MERCSIGFADRAIAVHKPHLDALVRHGNPAGKFIILLNLPDPKIFANRARASGRNDSGLKLIYHGMVAERHGLKVAVRAISSLRQEIQGLEFKIVGEGDGIPGLIELVNELGLTDCVEFSKGYVPLEELVPIILDADVGIVPILYDDFTRYMLPTKLLEYVALGKPVICSRTATIEAYFDDSMVAVFYARRCRRTRRAYSDSVPKPGQARTTEHQRGQIQSRIQLGAAEAALLRVDR